MTDFSFITTCKGRLHHLQQTLPLLARQENSECVVVDYGCPQKTGDWVEQHCPQVKVMRVTDDEGFCLARARNMGAQVAQSERLIFIDADIRLVGDLLSWLRPRLGPGIFFRAGSLDSNMTGTFVCHRGDFNKIGGYDELLRGWGREDKDIYYRLRLAGCEQGFFPEQFLDAIAHSDEERTQFSPYKNRWVSHLVSSLYLQMKYDLESLSAEKPGMEARQRLYEHARQNVLRIVGEGANADPRIRLLLGEHPGLPSTSPIWGIQRVLVYTLHPHTAGNEETPGWPINATRESRSL